MSHHSSQIKTSQPIQFVTSTLGKQNRQVQERQYIKNEHLSTPPSNHRFKTGQLQQGRQFIPNLQASSLVTGNFAQTNPIRQVNQSETFRNQSNPRSHTSSMFQSQNQFITKQFIVKEYQQKQQEYINRIKKLQDYEELNYPDNGKYIGQITYLNGTSPSFGNASNSRTTNQQTPLSSMSRNGQGIFFYPTGDVYFGGWKDEMFNGQGVYIFKTGEIYDGLLKNSLKEGTGTYYYQNTTAFYSGTWSNDMKNGTGQLNSPEQYYQGQWKNGLKHGNGYYKNKINRIIYVGEFVQGLKQGKGRIVYPDGSVFAGQFKRQLPHGVGDFQYSNKDKYIGQFVEGKKEGRGNYFFSEGTIFSGLWKDDSKIQGELTLFNGDTFNGCFRDNQRFQGVYRYRNGDVYEGTWKDDLKQGFGKLYLQNGQKYQGKFVEGQKHGEGIYSWKNGDRYQGQFLQDKRQGLGEYYWSDGGVYKGEWKTDRMNGFGRLVKDGVDVVGQFFADHFQKPVYQEQLGALRNFILN